MDDNLLEKLLEERGIAILDGATGTELERRGVPAPLPLWTGDAAVRAPDVLRQIHGDYLQAGADIVTANTFRTHPYTLRALGREAEVEALSRRSVDIAREACLAAGRGLVAGSLSPLEDCYYPERVPPGEILCREHALQARNLAAAGVDLILVETMSTWREAEAAAQAALATGLPVLVSLIPSPDGDGDLLSGDDLETAWRHLCALDVASRRLAGCLVNCAPPAVLATALERMRTSLDDRPLGAYANLGHGSERAGWRPDDETPPQAYGVWACRWAELGARIIGGCCGTTPEHIRAAARALGRR